jgi:hypothetical protein
MGGSDSGGAPSVYGTLGIPAPGNIRGARDYAASWTDKFGNLRLFGGYNGAISWEAGAHNGFANDLWEFSPSTDQWTWMGEGGTFICNEFCLWSAWSVRCDGNTGSREFSRSPLQRSELE